MNRLATRLLLAFLAVALLSLVAVPALQSIAARRTFGDLNPEFRGRIERSLRGPPRRDGAGPPPFVRNGELLNGQLPGGQSPNGQLLDRPPPDEGFLREENARLFELLGAYRVAQRQAALFAVGGAILLSVLLALLLSRTIARPIEAVSKAASHLAAGDLTARVNLGQSYPADETRALAFNFNRMAEALAAYEGERKAMIADIAHELRNPLATLQLRIDALSDGLVQFGDDEARLLQGQVGLPARLIGDLRTLSLADANRLSLERLELDLSDLAEGVVSQARPKAEGAGVRLEFTSADSSALVNADPDRLTQILNNLLDNAFRETPKGGEVAVNLFVTPTEVVLQVRDTGPGIPEDELGTVFERFVQGRRRDTKSAGGSGLGLAIVQSLVKLHGGRVQAGNWTAEGGSGAQLEVGLPRPQQQS